MEIASGSIIQQAKLMCYLFFAESHQFFAKNQQWLKRGNQ